MPIVRRATWLSRTPPTSEKGTPPSVRRGSVTRHGFPAPSVRDAAIALGFHSIETYFDRVLLTPLMTGSSLSGAVGARPNDLLLYRCLVCGFQTLKTGEITEHLMSHAEAAKYTFSTVIKD